MKKFLILISLTCIPQNLIAAAPPTQCPDGFTTINKRYGYFYATGSSCPSNMTATGTTIVCGTIYPNNKAEGSCILYAPANTPYTDNTGTYEFVEACPLE